MDGAGPDQSFAVLTWLHSAKAIAIAVQRYRQAHPDAPIYDVHVTSLGPAPRGAGGAVDVGGDLHDRYEF